VRLASTKTSSLASSGSGAVWMATSMLVSDIGMWGSAISGLVSTRSRLGRDRPPGTTTAWALARVCQQDAEATKRSGVPEAPCQKEPPGRDTAGEGPRRAAPAGYGNSLGWTGPDALGAGARDAVYWRTGSQPAWSKPRRRQLQLQSAQSQKEAIGPRCGANQPADQRLPQWQQRSSVRKRMCMSDSSK
jgi:hypothetical protein